MTPTESVSALEVAFHDDITLEDTETLILVIASPIVTWTDVSFSQILSDKVTLEVASITLTILDSEQPLIGFDPTASYAFDESDVDRTVSLSLVISGNGSLTQAVPITVVATDMTATSPQDYVLDTPTLTIPLGTNSATISHSVSLTIVGDDRVEADETLSLHLTSSLGQVSSTAVTITIRDDDLSTVSLVDENGDLVSSGRVDYAAQETDPSVILTLDASGVLETSVSIRASTEENTAGSEDYVAQSEVVALSQGRQTLVILLRDDVAIEASEEFTVRFAPIAKARFTSPESPPYVRVTIYDDDQATVVVSVADNAYEEGSALEVSLGLERNNQPLSSRQLETAVAVSISTASDADDQTVDATPESDYIPLIRQSVLFLSRGATTQIVTLESVEDELVEPTETFLLTFEAASDGHVTLSTTALALSLLDNDSAIVSLKVNQSVSPLVKVNETDQDGDDNQVTLSVSLSRPVFAPVEVSVRVLEDPSPAVNTQTATAQDYRFSPTSATFLSGETLQEISLTIVADGIAEENESLIVEVFGLTFSSALEADAIQFAENAARTRILIVENSPIISMRATTTTLSEGETVVIHVSVSSPLSQATTLEARVLGVDSSPPIEESDYRLSSSTILIRDEPQEIAVSIVDDSIVEGPESFMVEVSLTVSEEEATLASDPLVSPPITIIDDDTASLDLTLSSTILDESDEQDGITVTPTLSSPVEQEVRIDLEVVDLTARFGVDYTLSESLPRTFRFLPLTTTALSSLKVTALSDTLLEEDERFQLSLDSLQIIPSTPMDSPLDSLITVASTTLVTIQDDDSSQVRFEVLGVQDLRRNADETLIALSVLEGTSFNLRIYLHNPDPLQDPFTITASLLNTVDNDIRTADAFFSTEVDSQPYNDYVLSRQKVTLTSARPSDTIMVSIVADDWLEGEEVYRLSLVDLIAPQTVVTLSPDVLEVTIVDRTVLSWRMSHDPSSLAEEESVMYRIEYQGATLPPPGIKSQLFSILLTRGGSVDNDDLLYTLEETLSDVVKGMEGVDVRAETSDRVRVIFFRPESVADSPNWFRFSLYLREDGALEEEETLILRLSDPLVNGVSLERQNMTVEILQDDPMVVIEAQGDTTQPLNALSKLVTPLILRTAVPLFGDLIQDRVADALSGVSAAAPYVDRQTLQGELRSFIAEDQSDEDSLLWNTWISGGISRVDDGVNIRIQGEIGHLWLGTDYGVARDWIFGVLAGYERSRMEIEEWEGVLSGRGVHAGLYSGGRVYGGVSGHLGVLFSHLHYKSSTNTPFASEGSFHGQRWTLTGGLRGEWRPHDLIRVSPTINLMGAREWHEEYSDSQGLLVRAERIDFARVVFGPEVGFQPFNTESQTLETWVSVEGVYDFHGSGSPLFYNNQKVYSTDLDDRFSFRTRVGLRYIRTYFQVRVNGIFSSVGDDFDFSSVSGSAQYRLGRRTRAGVTTAGDSDSLTHRLTLERDF